MPRPRAGGGRGGQGGSGTFDGGRTHVLRVWAGAGGWVGLGLRPLLVVEAHGHSTRPRCTRLDLTDPNAQSQGPPDCGQSPDLPQRERVCVGRAWAGGCGGWHSRLSGHTAPPPQAQLCFGGRRGGGCWHTCSFHGLGVVGGRVLRAPAVGQGDYNAESTGRPGVG